MPQPALNPPNTLIDTLPDHRDDAARPQAEAFPSLTRVARRKLPEPASVKAEDVLVGHGNTIRRDPDEADSVGRAERSDQSAVVVQTVRPSAEVARLALAVPLLGMQHGEPFELREEGFRRAGERLYNDLVFL